MQYGDVLTPAQLCSPPLPSPRGPLSGWLFDQLARPAHAVQGWPSPQPDALYGEDEALALYCLYELHYRGFAGMDERWEWEPTLLGLRRELEERFESRLEDEIGTGRAGRPRPDKVGELLREVVSSGTGPSLSRFLAAEGTVELFREFAIHRSAYQLKEADPHTWCLPRLSGRAKAAMVEIQADEYGDGVERDMHQTLFAVTMAELGLDPSYGAYLDRLPASTLAAVNLVSFLGLHRRHRGALVGHLAVFEMTSVEPMGRYAAALRRLGFGPSARHFYEVHVVADAHHQTVAATALAGGLARQEPEITANILFGARAVMAVEGRFSTDLMHAWTRGESSLRPAAAAASVLSA